MFESRCGICCGSCEGREEANCKGCVQMKVPFWGGECEVKSCCEEKQLDHCGQCAEFPCVMLKDMGKEQGYDSSAKIAQCKRWAQEEAAETAATATALGLL